MPPALQDLKDGAAQRTGKVRAAQLHLLAQFMLCRRMITDTVGWSFDQPNSPQMQAQQCAACCVGVRVPLAALHNVHARCLDASWACRERRLLAPAERACLRTSSSRRPFPFLSSAPRRKARRPRPRLMRALATRPLPRPSPRCVVRRCPTALASNALRSILAGRLLPSVPRARAERRGRSGAGGALSRRKPASAGASERKGAPGPLPCPVPLICRDVSCDASQRCRCPSSARRLPRRRRRPRRRLRPKSLPATPRLSPGSSSRSCSSSSPRHVGMLPAASGCTFTDRCARFKRPCPAEEAAALQTWRVTSRRP